MGCHGLRKASKCYYSGGYVAAGYELYRKNRFTIDIQTRFRAGSTQIQNGGKMTGTELAIGIGFNWY